MTGNFLRTHPRILPTGDLCPAKPLTGRPPKGYSGQMKTTSVTSLKNSLSARLREVAEGDTLLITDRNKPVATLQPLHAGQQGAHLETLYACGVISPPQNALSLNEFLRLPKAARSPGLTAAVLEEREAR